MDKRVKFVLEKEQVEFLRSKYPDVPIAQRVLATEKDLHFDISADDDCDFFLWLDDESVATMDVGFEPTKDTYMIESIIDYMHFQETENE